MKYRKVPPKRKVFPFAAVLTLRDTLNPTARASDETTGLSGFPAHARLPRTPGFNYRVSQGFLPSLNR